MEMTITGYLSLGQGGSIDTTELAEIANRLKIIVNGAEPAPAVVIPLEEIVSQYTWKSWDETIATKCITTNPWLSDLNAENPSVNVNFSNPAVWYINDGSGEHSYRQGITIPVVYSTDGNIWRFCRPSDFIDPNKQYTLWNNSLQMSTDNWS